MFFLLETWPSRIPRIFSPPATPPGDKLCGSHCQTHIGPAHRYIYIYKTFRGQLNTNTEINAYNHLSSRNLQYIFIVCNIKPYFTNVQ